ncbi:MAG: SRPBCC domain-containing protein [Phycisphaeraceae bacterium]|nr:SRPBCC domain-containing protein [Phycisphaeraceae bacterium]
MTRTLATAVDATVEVTRVIAAPPADVYKAWTQPRFIRRWFTAGEAMPHCDFTPEVGRDYSLGFVHKGRTGSVTGKVLEAVPNERLVYTWTVNGLPDEDKDTLVTVTFRKVDEGTEVRIRHERLTTESTRNETLDGWTQIVELLDRMAQIDGLESQIEQSKRKLAAMRRDLPRMRVPDSHVTDHHGKRINLSDLFGSRNELILIHNMGRKCVYCTLWADGFNGFWRHMHDRAPVAVLSPDEPSVQREFASSRGWTFPMFSTHGSDLAKVLGFENEQGTDPYPGVSTLRKDPDGSIWRIAHTHFGPGDDFCAVWHVFALLDRGVNDWSPKYTYQHEPVQLGTPAAAKSCCNH